ncbi:MAG: thioredoxin domain-containing protein [Acidobacteria bacterium]|nr:thioredoxin domain-containing protein [Acidobacteriota bacterium]
MEITENRPAGNGRETRAVLNRLAGEKSPYLLQHADNPVDWRPWGAEAFETARREDKPIFLSIGYATCHWCHVMEQESFRDPEIAALLNHVFVPVKVDREERPDVDHAYMAVCQALTGGGGWPLTVAADPWGRPFFAATYIPDRPRFGHPGIRQVVRRIEEAWHTRRSRVDESSREILAAVNGAMAATAGAGPDPGAAADDLFRHYCRLFDPDSGGFGPAPKFPAFPSLFFLQRYGEARKARRALEMVTRTLDAIRLGGIRDHVGQGIHRYSTDRRWFVPHFEKMLYDQALMALAYLESFRLTGKKLHAEAARDLLAYLRRDLRDPGGAFHAAEDADSEGVEGLFYLWTETELRGLLPPAEAERVIGAFGVRPEGNLGARGDEFPPGANLLSLREDPEGEEAAAIRRSLEALRAARAKRVRPMRDRKILADWNGLAVAALAAGSRVLADPDLAEAGREAARFVLGRLGSEGFGLRHRYCDGEAAVTGFLDDYAFLAQGLLELHAATGEPEWLEAAEGLAARALRSFSAPDGRGCCFSPSDGETLVVRVRVVHDGALPSGNGVLLRVLGHLARETGKESWQHAARDLRDGLRWALAQPPAVPFLLGAMLESGGLASGGPFR